MKNTKAFSGKERAFWEKTSSYEDKNWGSLTGDGQASLAGAGGHDHPKERRLVLVEGEASGLGKSEEASWKRGQRLVLKGP